MDRTRREVIRVGAGAVLGAGALGVLGTQVSGVLSGPRRRTEPRALVAGSLLALASAVPGASVEAHGSLAVRQLVVDGARDPDALALADPALFEGLADEITLFATNALVVAYDPASEHAGAIREDWADALARDGVRIGRTDPEADPLGYRTVLALALAERYGIADRSLLDDSLVFPETDLMRALEAGGLDAAFVYRNMAAEHDLPAVDLPASIDFSDPSRADQYGSVSMELDGRTVRGAPIRYAATAVTERGRPWVGELVGGTERLRDHGFGVPHEYPVTRPVPGATTAGE